MSLYIDAALDEQTMDVVNAHLESCDECREEVEMLRMLVSTALEVEFVDPPADLRARIATATTLAPQKVSIFAHLQKIFAAPAVRWAAAASAAVLIAIGFTGNPKIEQHNAAGQVKIAATQSPRASVSSDIKIESTNDRVAVSSEKVRVAKQIVKQRSVKRISVASTRSYKKNVERKITKVAALPKAIHVLASESSIGQDESLNTEVIADTTEAETKETTPEPVSYKIKMKESAERIAELPIIDDKSAQQAMAEIKAEAQMRKGHSSGSVSILSAKF